MNKIFYLFISVIIVFQNCNGQTTAEREIYNKDFKWSIKIPENFENVSADEWTKLQNKGAEAIENTYDEKIVNQSKTIFVFKSDQLNYFESNYQPYDVLVDGDYIESCKIVNQVLYETFLSQIPGIKIDTISTVEKIDNLEFRKFKMKIVYPNKMVFNVIMYSRLFGKREFSVNIMYVDNRKGQLMLEAWKNSKFSR